MAFSTVDIGYSLPNFTHTNLIMFCFCWSQLDKDWFGESGNHIRKKVCSKIRMA